MSVIGKRRPLVSEETPRFACNISSEVIAIIAMIERFAADTILVHFSLSPPSHLTMIEVQLVLVVHNSDNMLSGNNPFYVAEVCR